MNINFNKAGKGQGCNCSKCGTYIENIFTISSNGITLHVGTECFKTIQEQTNLSDYGKEQLKKDLNSLTKAKKEIENIEQNKIEKLSKSNQIAVKNYGIEWVNTLIYRLDKETKEINKKYQNINL